MTGAISKDQVVSLQMSVREFDLISRAMQLTTWSAIGSKDAEEIDKLNNDLNDITAQAMYEFKVKRTP